MVLPKENFHAGTTFWMGQLVGFFLDENLSYYIVKSFELCIETQGLLKWNMISPCTSSSYLTLMSIDAFSKPIYYDFGEDLYCYKVKFVYSLSPWVCTPCLDNIFKYPFYVSTVDSCKLVWKPYCWPHMFWYIYGAKR